MKTNNFLWATLATAILTLTGCSSDDNELTVPQPQDKTALLELQSDREWNKYQSNR